MPWKWRIDVKKRSGKQIAALAAVVLLAALYLLSAICTVVIPLFAWIFIWIYGQVTGKKTIADLNLMQDVHQEKKEDVKANGKEEAVAETDEKE